MYMKNFKQNSVLAGIALCTLSLAVPSALFAAGPAAVDLSSAGNFAILAKSGISATGTTAITGDIGVSPIGATSITGFSLNLPAASAYATSPLVTGKVYAPGYADPTPTTLTTAVGNMETAYTNAAGRTNPTATELGAGNIGGLTIAPGLYKWGTGVIIPSDVTIAGSANDVWIFQIAQTLTVSSSVRVNLSGGAKASNIFWIVAGQTTIGTGASFSGTILDQTGIVLNTGATLNGRALAQTAVTLDANSVTIPSGSASVATAPVITPTPIATPTPTPTPTPTSTSIQTSVVSTASGSGSVTSTVTSGSATSTYTTVTKGAPSPDAPAIGQQVRAIAINLGTGNNNASVKSLQQFLISQNTGRAAVSLASVGATAYFGPLTRAALAEFQAKVGISPALGNFGPITRAYLTASK
jgi:hypothetical protein